MKHNHFKHLFTTLLLLCTMVATAHDFEVDGIYYNIKDAVNKTVEVTYKGISYAEYFDEYTGSIVIPDIVVHDDVVYSVASIGNDAFKICTDITSIKIPNTVTSIGSSAFYGCTGLKEIYVFSAKPATITSKTFNNYSATLYVPGGVKSAYEKDTCWAAFTNITEFVDKDLEFTITSEEDATVTVTGYTGNQSTVAIPSHYTIDGKSYTVTSIGYRAFDSCSGLTSIVIPNSVTSIGKYAFDNCSALTSIVIPNSVISIGSYAFRECGNLKSVHISDLAAWCNIDFGIFYNGNAIKACENKKFAKSDSGIWHNDGWYGFSANPLIYSCGLYLNGELVKNLVIPDGISKVKQCAFYGYSGLESVKIANSVKKIEKMAFEGCIGLTSVVIPNSVTEFEYYAFAGCTGLTSITIPNSVTSIGNQAFRGCTGLTSIEIPNSVTIIGDFAFNGCKKLETAVIGNSVTIIPYYAFNGCTSLTSIVIPNSVTSIGDYAFNGCTSLTSIEIPNSVTRIGKYAFNGCKKLETAVIGKGIESISSSIFADCESLSDVYCFASSVPSTNSNAFENSYIEYATLHVPEESTDSYKSTEPWSNFGTIKAIVNEPTTINGVTYKFDIVEKSATVTANENGSYTGNVVIPETVKKNDTIYRVTTIGERAFAGCTNLTSITIPSSINIIEGDAFEECNGLTAVHISDLSAWCKIWIKTSHFTNPLFYAHNLYLNGKLVTDLVIPDDITEIKAYTFQSCNNFTSVTIPNHIIKIGQWAFYRCSGLQSITIPNSVTGINLNAFDGCSGLESITVESGNTRYDSRENCNAIIETTTNTLIAGCKNTVIPNSVTSIGIHAFYGCTGLTSIEIPNSVTSIGESTFSGCKGLTSITIPNSVTSIGIYAFEGCTGLSNIYLTSVVPPSISPYSFTNTQYKNAVLYVPQGTLATYQAADNWKNFTNITELVNEDLEFTITSEEDATVAISGYTGNKSIVTIPSHCTIDGKSYNVTSIGIRAFGGCTGLASIEIPNSVTSIGNQAFRGCTGLTSIEIPNSVTSIGNQAFRGCTSLTSVVIPNSITSIGNSVFEGCTGLTSITIPNSVTSIGYQAFRGCTGLTSVISYIPAGNLFTIDYFCDYDVYPACTLYVPNGAKEKYASTHEWDFFGVIVEMNTSGITLNRKAVILTEGETTALVTIVSIDGATDEDIIWSTSDNAVATVKNGLVTAIAPGSATITATVGGNSDSCVVTVAIPTTSLRELNNNTVYCICQPHHSKGATSWAVETDSNVLKSNVDLGIEMNIDDCRQQFAILSGDGGNTYFLYHVAEGKFICKDGTLSETPVDAINFMDGAYNGTFFAYFDSSHYVNVGGSRQMIIDRWNTPDGGNSCRLQPVGEFDPTEALEAIHDFTGIEEIKGEMRNEKGEIYDLRGRKLSEITAPGIYIIDGKKGVIK